MNPTVSIVTVAYNAAACIEKTIRSVLAQSYRDYEYVFIDGKSSDDTVQIIESYRKRFEDLGISFVVKSEPDKGIYDAMNKGIDTAAGTWVQMLNAGDALTDEGVLADMFSVDRSDADILYGNVILSDGGFYKLAKAGPVETIPLDMPMCHQGIFARRSVLTQYRFDTQYKLAADYDQMLRCYLDQKHFVHVDRAVAVYDTTGVSEKNFKRCLTEQEAVRSKFGYHREKPIWHSLLMRRRAELIKKLLPSVSRSEARGWYRSLNRVLENL